MHWLRLRRKSDRPRRVVLCGYYGAGNLGDALMLEGFAARVEEAVPGALLRVAARQAGTVRDRHPWLPPGAPVDLDNPRRLTVFRRAGRFVLGGGDLLRDRPEGAIAPLWLQHLREAQRAGCATAVAGVSVGDLWRPESIAAIRETFPRCGLVAVRDERSRAALDALGTGVPIEVMPDPALAWLCAQPRAERPAAGRPMVGIALRDLAGRGRDVDPAASERLAREIGLLADRLHEAGYGVCFFACQAPADVLANLEAARFARHSASFGISRGFAGPAAAVAAIGALDVVVGMRLHAIVAAAALGVPFVAIDYDVKVRAFLEELGAPEAAVPVAGADADGLFARVEAANAGREAAARRLALAVAALRARRRPAEVALAAFLRDGRAR
jgi:polysaccharide pyruvyl transferase WcaK-like protein